MNSREHNKKFAENSNIKGSEFDRQNANVLGKSSCIQSGPEPNSNNSLFNNLISVIIAIVFFCLSSFFLKFVINDSFYNSVEFLFILLLVSILINFLTFYILQKNKKKV